MTELAQDEVAVVRLLEPYFSHYWPHIEKQLDTVEHAWRPWWTKDFLYEGVLNNVIQCWSAGTPKDGWRLIVFTQIVNFPERRTLLLMTALGQGLDDMLPQLEATLERFALENQCTDAEIHGRLGWKAKLAPLGFTVETVVLRKKLEQRSMH
jgi:hypothetical protein